MISVAAETTPYNETVPDQFSSIAAIYDRLMTVIPYPEWVVYLKDLAARERHTMRRVLDVGCGTGTVSLLLADDGFDVVGFDASPGMVEEAQRKAGGRTDIRFFTERVEQLDIPERFDTAISLFDTLNYVIEPADLQEGLRRVYRHLEPGGLFMFDMNTPYALEEELFTQNNLGMPGSLNYIWKSRYNPEERLTTVDMTFHIREGGRPHVITQTHYQRAYRMNEVKDMLSMAGFEPLNIWEAYGFRHPNKRTDRVYFTARKPQE